MSVPIQLPKALNAVVIAQLKAQFSEQEIRASVRNTNSAVYLALQKLKIEQRDLFNEFKTMYPEASTHLEKQEVAEWELYQKFVKEKPQRDLHLQLREIHDIGDMVASYAKKSLFASVSSGALGLYYLRSNHLFALAHLSTSVALLTIWKGCSELELMRAKLDKVWEAALIKPSDETLKSIQEVFEEGKRHFFIRCYLTAQEKVAPKEQDTPYWQALFNEEIAALQAMRQKLPIRASGDVEQIKRFFSQFEKMIPAWKWGASSWAAGAFALACYAAQKQSHFIMAVASVHFLAAGYIGRKLFNIHSVSIKVTQADNESIVSAYQKLSTFAPSIFVKVDSLKYVHYEVIRLDAILKLIPAWKSGFSLENNQLPSS